VLLDSPSRPSLKPLPSLSWVATVQDTGDAAGESIFPPWSLTPFTSTVTQYMRSSPLAASASPVSWTVATQDNDGNGFELGRLGESNSTLTIPAFRFDVKGTGASPGTYNVTIRISYGMMNSQSEGDLTTFNEDEDNVQFVIDSNVAVGTPVPLTDALAPMPLYGGARFQLVGVPVTTLSGPLDDVVASLSVPPSGALQILAPAGTTLTATLGRLTGTSTLYFRLDMPMVDPGVYNASNANITLTMQYMRERNWNGSAASIPAEERRVHANPQRHRRLSRADQPWDGRLQPHRHAAKRGERRPRAVDGLAGRLQLFRRRGLLLRR
jgi:hypothetical protein